MGAGVEDGWSTSWADCPSHSIVPATGIGPGPSPELGASMTARRFDRRQLLDAAFEKASCDDLGDPTWQEGLDRVLDDLGSTAQLNEVGATMAETEIVNSCPTGWASSNGGGPTPRWPAGPSPSRW